MHRHYHQVAEDDHLNSTFNYRHNLSNEIAPIPAYQDILNDKLDHLMFDAIGKRLVDTSAQ